jgi:hypothetical protein
MPMRRDPATGLVGRAYVDPTDNPYYKNPKTGDIRRAFLKHLDEERKEEMEQLNNLIASGKIDEATRHQSLRLAWTTHLSFTSPTPPMPKMSDVIMLEIGQECGQEQVARELRGWWTPNHHS